MTSYKQAQQRRRLAEARTRKNLAEAQPSPPWQAKRSTLHLEQNENGEWIIRYWLPRAKKWSNGVRATDFEVSLWKDLQEARVALDMLRKRLERV